MLQKKQKYPKPVQLSPVNFFLFVTFIHFDCKLYWVDSFFFLLYYLTPFTSGGSQGEVLRSSQTIDFRSISIHLKNAVFFWKHTDSLTCMDKFFHSWTVSGAMWRCELSLYFQNVPVCITEHAFVSDCSTEAYSNGAVTFVAILSM